MADGDDCGAADDFCLDDDVLGAEFELDTAELEVAEVSTEPLAEEPAPAWCEVHAVATNAVTANTSP